VDAVMLKKEISIRCREDGARILEAIEMEV
jgi:hypothetical protein